MLVAIDPGWEQSAYVIYDGEKPIAFKIIDNDAMLAFIRGVDADVLVIEQVACMGMAVGAEIFETVFWSGRFAEAWAGKWDRVKRHEVKMHLCGNMRAKDANIRTAIIDRYGPGKDKAIGRKKSPGPLFGLSGDCWSALAVAITWTETKSP
jgi:hypothetical protein